jgi:uncharacterized protein YegL
MLVDVSGSMAQEGKIEALNFAIRELIAASARAASARILVAVIAFGAGGARIVCPLRSAAEAKWSDLEAEGDTPLAEALSLARATIERDAEAETQMLRPVLVLVSDGRPTDERQWQAALDRLDSSPVAGLADRLALAIGPDADLDFLDRFVKPSFTAAGSSRVVQAGSTSEIVAFFRYLPMRLEQGVIVNPQDLAFDTSGLT